MKRGFDNFNAVDKGFYSIVGNEVIASPQVTNYQTYDSLIASLPQIYQDVLNEDNLLSKLNTTQIQELQSSLTYIASRDAPTDFKVRLAKSKINSYEPLRLQIGEPTYESDLYSGVKELVRELERNGDIDQATKSKLGALSVEQQKQLAEQLKVSVLDNRQLSQEERRTMAISILTNAISPQNLETKSEKSESQSTNQQNKALIILGVAILGFIAYTSMKK
jgi:hypothetical protein